ncbi:hypothetical protein UlMin_037721 [Ulmus minor]
MDREQQELQFLGFFGIFKETFKIVFSWRKIFSQITLALILPLSFIFLAHLHISQVILMNIQSNFDKENDYNFQNNSPSYTKIKNSISTQWVAFWSFKVAYFVFLVIFSLLSTAAVVYTIACIYTAKQISFKKVMSVVPKVWKRLMVTFLWSFAIVFVYNLVAIGFIILAILLIGVVPILGFILSILFLIGYLSGFVYIGIIWHLASVVSVLEDVYGIKAMKKSRNLIKGKKGLAVAFFVLLAVCFGGIEFMYEDFVVLGSDGEMGIRIGIGIVCFLLLLTVILFGLVIQTIIYFVCKSYHHENIDKPSLSEHLEAYLGDYVRLRGPKDVQLGETDHV